MTPKTIAKLRNLDTDKLRKLIARVAEEVWADDNARVEFLKTLRAEEASREK